MQDLCKNLYRRVDTGLRKSETKPTTFLIQETRPWILLLCCQPQNESQCVEPNPVIQLKSKMKLYNSSMVFDSLNILN